MFSREEPTFILLQNTPEITELTRGWSQVVESHQTLLQHGCDISTTFSSSCFNSKHFRLLEEFDLSAACVSSGRRIKIRNDQLNWRKQLTVNYPSQKPKLEKHSESAYLRPAAHFHPYFHPIEFYF